MSSTDSICWSSSQRQALSTLLEMANLFFYNDLSSLPIRPRIAPLCVASSGSGKSFVIRELANRIGVPLMRLTPSNWVVAGAKDMQPTLLRVYQFVDDNDQGIIAFDECDKYRLGSSDWSHYTCGELLDLLDRSPSAPIRNVEWTNSLLRKLRTDFFFVGSGTWESVWADTSKPKLGFGHSHNPGAVTAEVRRRIDSSDAIPPEIRKRFNSQLVILGPPTVSDYAEAAEKMGLARLANELRMPLDFAAASQSGKGCRWIEETMADLLLYARQARPDLLRLRARVPESFEPENDALDFGMEDDEPVL